MTGASLKEKAVQEMISAMHHMSEVQWCVEYLREFADSQRSRRRHFKMATLFGTVFVAEQVGLCVLNHQEPSSYINNKLFVADCLEAAGRVWNMSTHQQRCDLMKTFFLYNFEADLEMETSVPHEKEAEIDECDDKEVEAQGVLDALKRFSSYVRPLAWIRSGVGKFWDVIKEAFFKAFGYHLDKIKKAFSWIEACVDQVKAWVEKACEQFNKISTHLYEFVVIALAMTGTACVLHLLDRMLAACGFLEKPLGMSGFFITGMIGLMCVTTLGLSMKNSSIMGLTDLCKQHCMHILQKLFGVEEENSDYDIVTQQLQAQSQFADVLMAMGEGLQNLRMSTVKEFGQTVGAIHSFKMGITSGKNMIGQICTYLSDMISLLLGRESPMLTDLGLLLGNNITQWIEEVEALVRSFAEKASFSREKLDRARTLKLEGIKIRSKILEDGKSSTHALLTAVSKAMDKLNDLEITATIAGSNGVRKTPFWLAFCGEAGVGKSTLMGRMCMDLLNANHMDPELELYARNGDDEYFSGYRMQYMVTYDDFAAVERQKSDEMEIIRMISSQPLQLNMADLKEKGMRFDSRIIVSSSNFKDASPHGKVHDLNAFRRRRSVLVEVLTKPGVPYDENDPQANQLYRILDKMSPFDVRMVFDNYDELYAYVMSAFMRQDAEQVKLIANMRGGAKEIDLAAEFRECVTRMASVTSFPPSAVIEEFSAECSAGRHPVYVGTWDGKAHFQYAEDMYGPGFETLVPTDDLDALQKFDGKLGLALIHMLSNNSNVDPLMSHLAKKVLHEDIFSPKSDLPKDPALQKIVLTAQDARWQRHLLASAGNAYRIGKDSWVTKIWDDYKVSVKDVFSRDSSDWPLSIKLLLGMVCSTVVGYTMYKSLMYLWSLGVTPASVAATACILQGQSQPPSGRNGAEGRFRNLPIRKKAWAQAQSLASDSYIWLAERCLAHLHYGNWHATVLLLPGQHMLICGHLAEQIPNGSTVRLVFGTMTTYVVWRSGKVIRCKDSELYLFYDQTLPLIKQVVKDRMIIDAESKLNNIMDVTIFSDKFNSATQSYECEVGKTTARPQNETFTIVGTDYKRKVPKVLKYDVPTINHDCGSVIFVEVNGVYKIAGIHIAGNGKSGYASPIPDEVSGILVAQSILDEKMEEYDYIVPLGTGCEAVGIMKKEFRQPLTGKTSFVAMEPQFGLDYPNEKIPSIISSTDARLKGTKHEGFNPLSAGMTKYSDEAGPFEEELCDQVGSEMLDLWQDCLADFEERTFPEVSLEQAIAGVPEIEYFDSLVMGTSEGFPFVFERQHGEKGKARYIINGENGVATLDMTTSVGKHYVQLSKECSKVIPEIVGMEKPKDERVAIRKVYEKPKTRLFTVLPMSYNLLVRQKFLHFVRFIMEQRKRLTCQVGVAPHSREWNTLALRLLSKGNNILCCDYKSFDGMLPKLIMKKIANMINSLCGGSADLMKERENLLMACCERYGISGVVVYKVHCGIPSGFPLTVIINSILNEFLVRYCYKELAMEAGVGKLVENSFSEFVEMVCYGDDNLLSVSDAVKTWFNGTSLKQQMLKHGVTITDGTDKESTELHFRKLHDCDFLKRSFKLDDKGTFRGPLAKESLYGELHWVKPTGMTKYEAYLVNLESALREMYLHSPAECRVMRRKAMNIRDESGALIFQKEDIPPMCRIEAYHQEQMGGVVLKYGLVSDIMLTPELMGMDEVVDLTVHRMIECLPNVFVGCPSYFVREKTDVVVHCFNDNSKRFGFDSGRYTDREFGLFTSSVGVGVGGLPSAIWLRNTLMRPSNVILTIKKAWEKMGGRIVFLGGNDCVKAVVVCAAVMLTFGKIDGPSVNILLTKLLEQNAAYKHVFSVYPELFNTDLSKQKKIGCFEKTTIERW